MNKIIAGILVLYSFPENFFLFALNSNNYNLEFNFDNRMNTQCKLIVHKTIHMMS